MAMLSCLCIKQLAIAGHTSPAPPTCRGLCEEGGPSDFQTLLGLLLSAEPAERVFFGAEHQIPGGFRPTNCFARATNVDSGSVPCVLIPPPQHRGSGERLLFARSVAVWAASASTQIVLTCKMGLECLPQESLGPHLFDTRDWLSDGAPLGTCGYLWRQSWLSRWGWRRLLASGGENPGVVERIQGCCLRLHRAQDSPHNKESFGPKCQPCQAESPGKWEL